MSLVNKALHANWTFFRLGAFEKVVSAHVILKKFRDKMLFDLKRVQIVIALYATYKSAIIFKHGE